MNEVIIYPINGHVGLLIPSPGFNVSEVAKKDVPTGLPYMIIPMSELPEDDMFFEAWEADFSNPHGHGADYGVGSDHEVIDWNNDGTPVVRYNT